MKRIKYKGKDKEGNTVFYTKRKSGQEKRFAKGDYGYSNYERRMLGMPLIDENKNQKNKKKKTKYQMKLDWFKRHNQYLRSDDWKEIRRLIIERDKVCQKCGTDQELHVHHLNYNHYKNELLHLDCLMLVCKECHEKIHMIKDGKLKRKQQKRKERK